MLQTKCIGTLGSCWGLWCFDTQLWLCYVIIASKQDLVSPQSISKGIVDCHTKHLTILWAKYWECLQSFVAERWYAFYSTLHSPLWLWSPDKTSATCCCLNREQLLLHYHIQRFVEVCERPTPCLKRPTTWKRPPPGLKRPTTWKRPTPGLKRPTTWKRPTPCL